MKILLASSEVHPYSKTGGLADMVGAMAKALALRGHEVGVVTPLYRGVRENFPGLQPLGMDLDIRLGWYNAAGDVWLHRPVKGVTVYFVNRPEFYDRAGVYQENNVVFLDNEHRFLFLTKAAIQLAREHWRPDIFHVHDWQVSLAPLLLRHARERGGWADAPRTCITIHNLAYQGVFGPHVYELTNLPWDYFNPEGVEFYGQFNFLKAGIVFSDAVTTVSPRYAREILTEESGCALDGVLRARQADLTGILNGVDYEEWNTDHNPHLPCSYSARDLSGKAACKAALQAELGLVARPDTPLFTSVTRLTEQKGVDIQLGALEEMLAADIQFALLGSGSREYEAAYQTLAARHPGRCAVRLGYDNALAHRLEAGADFFLMPSRFEPCGLNQMYSLRYGTIPVVRATGGLDDSVIDATEDAARANGIKFREYHARALVHGIRKALALHRDEAALQHYRRNAMRADFSWKRTGGEYERVYRKLLKTPDR